MSIMNLSSKIASVIRDVPDFPKKGIIFKDITPLLNDPGVFGMTMDAFVKRYAGKGVTKVIGIEARGFIIAAPIALKLNAGFIPVRKEGKLPYKTISATYDLEYGKDTLQIHEDALNPEDKVLIVDDVLATGGTAKAVCSLVEKLGAKVYSVAMLIELGFLNGKEKLSGYDLFCLIKY